ncbi:MAG: AGE family epimerase/isomerase [Lachnospira sp.]
MEVVDFYNHLCNDIIPFWNKMRDNDNGGFYGYTDCKGVADRESVKGVILNSRILWFYSSAYQLLKKPELLDNAEHAFSFLEDCCLDKTHGGVYWSVSFDGMPYDETKHTYNQAFAIYALSAYYQASGNERALDIAYSLYNIIEEKCRDKDGYLEAFNREFNPVSNDKLSENGVLAERTMNTLLHVLESYTELYRADNSEKVGNNIKEIMQIFRTYVYNPEKKSCNVFFDMNYKSLINLESFGHDIEASWLIDRGLSVLGDTGCSKDMLPVINGLAEGAYLHGIDRVYHAMNNECENGCVDGKKVWWVQAEAVTGFFNAYENNPEKVEYLHISEQIWSYIRENIIDRNSGEWIENIESDNTVKPDQALVHPWKCPYHNGRMCIEMIQRLSVIQ